MPDQKDDNKQHKITIIINNVPHHVESTTITASDIRQLAGLPAEYEVWQVIKSPDPEGQLPVDDIQIIANVHIKSGDKFRVVPPGTFGGAIR